MNNVAFAMRCALCLLLAVAGLILFATAMSGDLADLLARVTVGPNEPYRTKEDVQPTANLLMLLGLCAAAGGPIGLLLAIRQRM